MQWEDTNDTPDIACARAYSSVSAHSAATTCSCSDSQTFICSHQNTGTFAVWSCSSFTRKQLAEQGQTGSYVTFGAQLERSLLWGSAYCTKIALHVPDGCCTLAEKCNSSRQRGRPGMTQERATFLSSGR